MKKHIRNEHYEKPLYPDYLIIEPDLWNQSHDDVNHIRPKTIKARNESRLQDYLNSSYGSGSVDIMLKRIDNNEIAQAITSLKNRKSVGGDGITAEIIKRNQNGLSLGKDNITQLPNYILYAQTMAIWNNDPYTQREKRQVNIKKIQANYTAKRCI